MKIKNEDYEIICDTREQDTLIQDTLIKNGIQATRGLCRRQLREILFCI